MKDNRPVNLDIKTFALPLPAYASILHRISGVFVFFGIAVLLYALDGSLASKESFEATKECLQSPLSKLVIWVVLSGLLYHLVAGIKHLTQDFGIGETLEGGEKAAKITIGVSVFLILVAGVWIW